MGQSSSEIIWSRRIFSWKLHWHSRPYGQSNLTRIKITSTFQACPCRLVELSSVYTYIYIYIIQYIYIYIIQYIYIYIQYIYIYPIYPIKISNRPKKRHRSLSRECWMGVQRQHQADNRCSTHVPRQCRSVDPMHQSKAERRRKTSGAHGVFVKTLVINRAKTSMKKRENVQITSW